MRRLCQDRRAPKAASADIVQNSLPRQPPRMLERHPDQRLQPLTVAPPILMPPGRTASSPESSLSVV